jgi:hypothetical protein
MGFLPSGAFFGLGDDGREAGIATKRAEVGLFFNIQVDLRLQTVVNPLTQCAKARPRSAHLVRALVRNSCRSELGD